MTPPAASAPHPHAASPASPVVSLLRQLGVVSATALVVSNMIGTGIFTTTGFLASDLGSAGIIFLIWIIGALCALAGAFCYSELGVNFPSSGGEYVYLTRAYGPTWGFMTGWVSFFAGFSAPIAAAALAFSDYLAYFWPELKQANSAYSVDIGITTLKLGGAQLCASALIAIFTVLNFYGVKLVAAVQNTLTTTKVAVILGLILLGLAFGNGDWAHFSQPAVRGTSTPLLAQFAISLFFIYVSYSGWNAATYVAEELKEPSKTLPLALALGTALVALLYLGLNVVFIYAVPLEEMKGVIAVGSLAASRLFGPEIAGIFALLMAVSLMSTVNAMVTIGPRVYYAMAKNGAFFSAAARVNEKSHAPVIAIACQGVVAMLITMTPFPDLIIYIGFALNFFAMMTVASLFKFRKQPSWQRIRVVSFAWPLLPLIFFIVGAIATVVGATLQPRIALAAVLTIVSGAAVYHYALRAKQT
ncbi:MAG TPA: amino acid permease [Bryobacteraceae bacterium]|nr:amino acid permease [Bryobacteraceae bacterium]